MISLKETNLTKEGVAVENSQEEAEALPEEVSRIKDLNREWSPGFRTEAVLFSSSEEVITSAATAWTDGLKLKW